MNITLNEIGIIHSPFELPKDMPKKMNGTRGDESVIELYPEYSDGLLDLDDFSHIILVFYFHKIEGHELQVTPFFDNQIHGVFATRSPRRPNHIGVSVVKLDKINGNRLTVIGADLLNGTPILDIKPYVPAIDENTECQTGWLKEALERLEK